MKNELSDPAGSDDGRATRILARKVAAELLLFFVPILTSGFALFLLNSFYRDRIRLMHGAVRWLLLVAVTYAAMALTSYLVGRLAHRVLPPYEYTFYTSAVFSLLVFLMVFMHCTAASIIFFYSVAISVAAGLVVYAAVGLPLILAKARRRDRSRSP